MPLINSLPPNGVASGPLPNTQSQALATVTGAAAASPTARLLLPNAVVSATAIPAYAPDVPRVPKPPAKPSSSSVSSALAAQFIAQTPDASDDDLSIFERRDPPSPQAQTAANEEPASPAATPPNASAANGVAGNASTIPTSPNGEQVSAAPASNLVTAAVTANPQAFAQAKAPGLAEPRAATDAPSQSGKKSAVNQMRGTSAYARASARQVTFTPAVLDAVS